MNKEQHKLFTFNRNPKRKGAVKYVYVASGGQLMTCSVAQPCIDRKEWIPFATS
jgi:hypothetical protein